MNIASGHDIYILLACMHISIVAIGKHRQHPGDKATARGSELKRSSRAASQGHLNLRASGPERIRTRRRAMSNYPRKETLEMKGKGPSKEEASKVNRALKAAESKLPKVHDHHPENLALASKLERMPLRRRAASQMHLLAPSESDHIPLRPARRRATNCPQRKKPETRQEHPSPATRGDSEALPKAEHQPSSSADGYRAPDKYANLEKEGTLKDFGFSEKTNWYRGVSNKAEAVKALHGASTSRPGQLGRGIYVTDDRNVALGYSEYEPEVQGYVLQVKHPESEKLRGIHYKPQHPGTTISRHPEKHHVDFKTSMYPYAGANQVLFTPDQVNKLQFTIDPGMPTPRKKSLADTMEAIRSSGRPIPSPRSSDYQTASSIGNTPRSSIGDTPRSSIGDTPRSSIGNTPRSSISDTPGFYSPRSSNS